MAHRILGQPPPPNQSVSKLSTPSPLPAETVSCIMDTDAKSQPGNEAKRSLPADSAPTINAKATKGAYPSLYHSSCLGFDDGCGRICSRSLIASQYRPCWRRDKSSLPINHRSVYPLRILYCMRRYSIIPFYPSFYFDGFWVACALRQ